MKFRSLVLAGAISLFGAMAPAASAPPLFWQVLNMAQTRNQQVVRVMNWELQAKPTDGRDRDEDLTKTAQWGLDIITCDRWYDQPGEYQSIGPFYWNFNGTVEEKDFETLELVGDAMSKIDTATVPSAGDTFEEIDALAAFFSDGIKKKCVCPASFANTAGPLASQMANLLQPDSDTADNWRAVQRALAPMNAVSSKGCPASYQKKWNQLLSNIASTAKYRLEQALQDAADAAQAAADAPKPLPMTPQIQTGVYQSNSGFLPNIQVQTLVDGTLVANGELHYGDLPGLPWQGALIFNNIDAQGAYQYTVNAPFSYSAMTRNGYLTCSSNVSLKIASTSQGLRVSAYMLDNLGQPQPFNPRCVGTSSWHNADGLFIQYQQ